MQSAIDIECTYIEGEESHDPGSPGRQTAKAAPLAGMTPLDSSQWMQVIFVGIP